MNDDERLAALMKIARDAHKYGSIERHLPKEFLERPRVVPVCNKFHKPEPVSDELMNTPYGLPAEYFCIDNAGLTQLARVPSLHVGSRRFKSYSLYQ